MTADFCVEALEEVRCAGDLQHDQCSQFSAASFIDVLQKNEIRISMDGRGAWRDNVFIELLWKSVKYEEVYLHDYDSVAAAKVGIGKYFLFCNGRRPRPAL
jgi:putative transposase